MGVVQKDHYEKFNQIGRRIAELRQKFGWTQQRLADEVGISLSYLSKIEASHSRKFFSLSVLFDIADALHVSAKDLLEDQGSSPQLDNKNDHPASPSR